LTLGKGDRSRDKSTSGCWFKRTGGKRQDPRVPKKILHKAKTLHIKLAFHKIAGGGPEKGRKGEKKTGWGLVEMVGWGRGKRTEL